MLDIKELWRDAPRNIDLDKDGDIHIESQFHEQWEEAGENWDLLLDMVEENIHLAEDSDDEEIDWESVEQEYDRTKALLNRA
jgi:hypothetical protein